MIYAVFAVLLIIDRITKIWANLWLSEEGSIDFIKGFLGFTYVENRGVAFGMLSDKLYIVLPVTIVVVIICICVYIKYRGKNKLFDTSLLFVITGAIGNIADKITRGFVVDFIEFIFIDFPVFNFADIYVCVGATLLIIYVLFGENNENRV